MRTGAGKWCAYGTGCGNGGALGARAVDGLGTGEGAERVGRGWSGGSQGWIEVFSGGKPHRQGTGGVPG